MARSYSRILAACVIVALSTTYVGSKERTILLTKDHLSVERVFSMIRGESGDLSKNLNSLEKDLLQLETSLNQVTAGRVEVHTLEDAIERENAPEQVLRDARSRLFEAEKSYREKLRELDKKYSG